jgi:hypothetical protein
MRAAYGNLVTWLFNSSRLRYAGRPSLLRKEGEE